MSHRSGLLANASLIVFALLLSEARAQEALPEIEIDAATKTPVAQERAPASVTVITGEQIEKGVSGRIGDILKTTPGIYMRGSAFDLTRPGNSVGTLTMRGIPGAPRTMMLVDGVPLNSPYAATIDYSTIPTTGIDRIEVVPGAFSSLYGTNAMGGIISITTKKPEKREFGFTTSVGGFATGNKVTGDSLTERVSAYYRDRFENGLGVSLNFSGSNSAGYGDEFATKAATTTSPGTAFVVPVCCLQMIPTSSGGVTTLLGNRGERPWNTYNVRGQLYYDLDEHTKLTVGSSFGRSYNGYSVPESAALNAAGFPVYNGWVAFLDQSGSLRRINLSDTSANAFLSFAPAGEWTSRSFLRGEAKIGDVTVKAGVNYTIGDAWFVSPVAQSTLLSAPTGIWIGGAGTYSPAQQERMIGNVQADIPIIQSNLLTVGMQYQRERFDRDVSDLANHKDPYSKTGAVSYSTHGRSNTLAFFAQDKFEVTQWLTLYAGGRYDSWRTSGSTWQTRSPVQSTLPLFSNIYPDRGAEAFSPKASAVLTFDQLTLRASVGRAFNTPQLFQMYTRSQTTLTNYTDGDPNLRPEKVTSWEVGFDYRFAETGTRVRATYYENQLYDLIYTYATALPGGVTQNSRTNAGRARVKGVEAGVEQALGIIVEGLTGFANVTHNDSSMVRNFAQPASVGSALTFTPEWMVNWGLAYSAGPWSAELNGRYTSKVYSDDQNRDTFYGIPTAYDPFFTMDTKVSYAFSEKLKASIVVTNLLDREYYQFYLQPRRAVFGEIAYRF
jgi:iron complex outermembrane recepter protein